MSLRASRRRTAIAAAVAATLAIPTAIVVASSSAAGSTPTFGQPVIVTPDDISEPGIKAAPDGTLYVTGPAGLLSNLPGSPSPVYRSDDGGTTWTRTPDSLRANLPGGGDSDVSIDPATGTLYMTDLWLGSATVSVSHDKGQTWIANPFQGTPIQDRQWIATTGGVTYHVTHQVPTGLVVSKSVDGGITYPLQTVAATPLDQTGCICPPGNLIAEGTGALAGLNDKVGVIYATSTGGVNFAHSEDGATTFTNTAVSPASNADTSTAFPVVADAGGGRLAAVWMEVIGGATRTRFATSPDFGATWTAPQTIFSSGTSLYPWVAAQGSKVSVSLYATSLVGTPDTMPASAKWYETYLESSDGGTTFSPAVVADPTPVKTGPVCTGGINCSGNRELGDFQSLAIDPTGAAVLAYVHSIDNVADTEIRVVKQLAGTTASTTSSSTSSSTTSSTTSTTAAASPSHGKKKK